MIELSRRKIIGISAAWVLAFNSKNAVSKGFASSRKLTVYKSRSCGCCGAWVEHMKSAGFEVIDYEAENLSLMKNKLGIQPELWSCHTGLIDGYVIEGHVPAREVNRFLTSRHPEAIGLSVPGMPIGSPGMEQGKRNDNFQVILFSATRKSIFAEYPQENV